MGQGFRAFVLSFGTRRRNVRRGRLFPVHCHVPVQSAPFSPRPDASVTRSPRWPLLLLGLLLAGVTTLRAQERAPVTADTVGRPAPAADSANVGDTTRVPLARRAKPPVSPMGAAVRSLILPGWGQFSLKKPVTGVIFVATEATFITLVVREQRRLNDLRRAVPADTAAIGAASRKREDWIVITAVNHVASAIEAYVSGYFFDFPDELKVRALPGGGLRADVTLPLRIR